MIRKLLKHVLGRVDTFVPANAYPKSMEVGGSERGYDTFDAIMTVSRPSESPGHDVKFVTKRIVDDNQTLGIVGSLPENLLDGGTRNVHEGFYDR